MRRSRSRLVWRNQGGEQRAYGDFRDYRDAGGRMEALVPIGQTRATTDQDVAQVLLARRLQQLEELRRGRGIHGELRIAALATFTREHLVAKTRAGLTSTLHLESCQLALTRAAEFFGGDRELANITVADVRRWAEQLQAMPGRRGRGLQGGTVRHHLNALSNLYRRAQGEGYVLPGYNPVSSLMEKPSARREEARWLEVHEAAALLEASRTVRPAREDLAIPFAYQLLATYLLTGGRKAEVLGLEVEDVSFNRRTVTFRPNQWRRLKTGTSFRTVPLWPQLEEILRPYVFDLDRPPRRLLFPSIVSSCEVMLTDFRRTLDLVAIEAGFKEAVLDPATGEQAKDAKGTLRWRGTVHSKMFRHTYCAARLQTLDRGAPVTEFTVGRELGHGGDALVRRVYGHLGSVRHRAEVVEYRFVTDPVTAPGESGLPGPVNVLSSRSLRP
jgi:integrase